jgi:large subunit ribosomal protein L9
VKIVLREHVDQLGERGDVVTVAAGYARNFLLPKGLAMPATPGNLRTIEHQRRVFRAKDAKELGEAQSLAQRLGDVELSIRRKAGQSGTLYGSVTRADIAAVLSAKGFLVDRRRIELGEPIKTIGAYEVPVRIHRQVTARVRLEVQGDPQG